MNRPRVLIEEWLPAQAIGIECMRERRSASALAPHTFLHVWWARRPLTISRAAVLGSLLPANFDRRAFERLLGFYGTSEYIVAKDLELRNKPEGTRIDVGHGKRAFANSIPGDDLAAAGKAVHGCWGAEPAVLDPMAGGGSIPLEAARLGFESVANELNPVACVILEATADYPFRFGRKLGARARHWSAIWAARCEDRLSLYYVHAGFWPPRDYLFARTVPCPDTGHPTPLVPDWSLSRPAGGPHVVAEPVVNVEKGTWTIRVRNVGREAGELAAPPRPTFNRGKGVSLFTGGPITAEYIKAQARLGRMGSALYAVATRARRGLDFRPAEETDLRALEAAERELERLRPGWEKEGVIPTELYPEVTSDARPRLYGMPRWADLFSPRQLLSMGVLVEELRRLRPEIVAADGEEMGEAVVHLLALVVDKWADFNSCQTAWHASRGVVGHAFQRHDYAFKPAFAEMAACVAGGGLEWAIDNVLDAYEKLADLPCAEDARPVRITQGSATNLAHLEDGSVTAVIVDPPYADNVQYSELADFFYVWLKRTQGHRRPEWFATYLCDRDLEAVVNYRRHDNGGSLGPKAATEAAHAFYQSLMTETFREARRVLRDDGVLTVMFTHKQQSAWAALFQSLIEAGFTITATWPVQTESSHSLNIAGKNAAQSTVILVARERDPGAGRGYYDDAMRRGIRDAARGAAERLREQGLSPLDQLVGSFGSAMEVFSRHDRVVTDTGEVVGVAEAIEAAANAVIEWRVERIAARGLDEVDPESRFYLLCWDVLRAGEFRFNEAMLLGRAAGMSVDQLTEAGLVRKAGEDVRILPAGERRRDRSLSGLDVPADNGKAGRRRRAPRQVHPNDERFDRVIDLCHALAMRYADAGGGENGIGAAKSLALRHGWRPNGPESAFLEALLRTAPEAVRYPVRKAKDSAAERYPEFRAWHSMFRSLTGREPEEWRPPRPPMNLFTAAALAEEERDEDAGYADGEDEEADEEGE